MTNQEFIESIRLEGEEWRDVVGYEGLYMVSSFGRVMSCEKHLHAVSKAGKDFIRTQQPFLMNLQISTTGYYITMLTTNYRREIAYVHRMVAQAFIPNPENKPQIDHIDTNRVNNILNNLRWCTQSENNLNPISNAKFRKSKTGISNPNKWVPIVSISKDGTVKHYHNICSVTKDGHYCNKVIDCLKGRYSQHHGLRWMYLSDYEKLVSMSKNSESI